jgi:UDP-N-acetyl-D-glucosamine/UDP-N-acetyl-D-galactosamine dehydrogenase
VANARLAKARKSRVGVIGLGYVGLPLAVEFGKRYETIGFDISPTRVAELEAGRDSTREVSKEELRAAKMLRCSTTVAALKSCNFYIVTVPTPVDRYKRPNLAHLVAASETIGQVLSKGDVVVYESTVYPGCTEEVCVPTLERGSGLKCNRDFYVGYSPERINPGDTQHRLTSIPKITAGSTAASAALIDDLYASIITAGTHKVSSIRVAEAAKVIENTQRDVNIALINEFALIFRRLGIDTEEVLRAAGTKWNFLPFRPGLVGGHCIGVDPYYFTHKAAEIGYHPEMILAGRRINDGMGAYVAQQVVKLMTERHIMVADSKILILGLAFKENCPDLRNSKVVDIVNELKNFDAQVDIYDPWVEAGAAYLEYGLRPLKAPKRGGYDAIVIAVGHDEFKAMGVDKIRRMARKTHVLYDVKYLFPEDQTDGRL